MQKQLQVDTANHRLDKWAVIYLAPTSVPLEMKPTGSVFRGMSRAESASAYAEQVAAFFRDHGLDKPVFVVRGPTSTSNSNFEVVTETAGYAVEYRTKNAVDHNASSTQLERASV